jgi:hypothetical protein
VESKKVRVANLREDHFRFLRRFRPQIYWIICLQNNLLMWIFKGINFKTYNPSTKLQNEKKNYLFVSRDFNQSNLGHIENLIVNFERVNQVKVIHEIRFGNKLFGNAKWLRKVVNKYKPSHIVILDPQLIGLPGVLGLISLFRLYKITVKNNVKVALILFDLHDPQGVLFSFICSKIGIDTTYICSTGQEAKKYFGINNAQGPSIESVIEDVDEFKNFSDKKFDLHLPRPSYEPRKTVVESIISKLNKSSLDIKYTVGGNFIDYRELRNSLNLTKIVIVTNSIIEGVIGHFPLPKGPNRQLVSYNAEALSSGALLIAQKCEALYEVFQPYIHFIPFDNADEAFELFQKYHNNPEAEIIARKGHEKFVELWKTQKLLGLDDTI